MIVYTKTGSGQTYGQLKKGSVFLQPEPRKEGIPLDFTAMVATDCNPGRELGNCSTYLPPPYTRSECEAACRNNPLCAVSSLSLCQPPIPCPFVCAHSDLFHCSLQPHHTVGSISTFLSACVYALSVLCAQGFNLPNGHMKTVDCAQDIRTGSSQVSGLQMSKPLQPFGQRYFQDFSVPIFTI